MRDGVLLNRKGEIIMMYVILGLAALVAGIGCLMVIGRDKDMPKYKDSPKPPKNPNYKSPEIPEGIKDPEKVDFDIDDSFINQLY